MAHKPEKPKWSLIQPLMPEIEQVVMLLTDGCRDHDDFGWMNEPIEEDYDAVMRHVSKMGEYDESGYLHEVHAIARLLFRLYKTRNIKDSLKADSEWKKKQEALFVHDIDVGGE